MKKYSQTLHAKGWITSLVSLYSLPPGTEEYVNLKVNPLNKHGVFSLAFELLLWPGPGVPFLVHCGQKILME